MRRFDNDVISVDVRFQIHQWNDFVRWRLVFIVAVVVPWSFEPHHKRFPLFGNYALFTFQFVAEVADPVDRV